MTRKLIHRIKKIHQIFSFSQLLMLLIGLSVFIQFLVISYNHYSGYHILNGIDYFALRLLRGAIIGLIAGFIIAYPDLFFINYLNKKFPWAENVVKRIAIQLSFAISLAIIISVLQSILANWIQPYKEDFKGVLVSNALIYSTVNIFVMAILEGWIFFSVSRQSEQKAKSLQEELMQIKFEVLKSQINPHFMFNSLNVLSGLIDKDVIKAQLFIDEFSHIYRYVLETIEQPVTTLEKELDFMRSYLFLQQIRYGEDLTWTIDIPAHLMSYLLPPLSLQVVLENAIKHNIINKLKPLKIEIYNQMNYLMIRNNIQPKISFAPSTGLGLKNLSKRYALIGNTEPIFSVQTNHYVAQLPLIEIESNECSDY